MSSKNSETEWTFIASWQVSSMADLSTSLNQLNEELASKLNSAAAMAREGKRSYELQGQGLTVRLYISRTSKGCRRVIYIEERTPQSNLSGDSENK